MTNICIVAHLAYGALRGGCAGKIGGVERQTSLTARWFAGRGHRVSLLAWDEGQPEESTIDGVRVIRMCRRADGLPGLRFFHPRWTSLVRGMERADADLYYQNCAEYVTGQVAHWCRHHGRRFLYSVASDPDCDPRLPEMRTLRERVLYRYGLRAADSVVVQTRKQQEMLWNGFGVKSVVMPMPCPGPSTEEIAFPREEPGRRVIWIGRIAPVKRLEWLLDIASRLDDVTFDIAGLPDVDDAYSRAVLIRARELPNVIVHGRVERDRMPDLYRGATLLCCTSLFEGFPNTFLEAWSYGIPIVSTVDPDGIIATENMGIVARDAETLTDGIRELIGSAKMWRCASANARRHFLENHDVERVMPRFERLFLGTLAGEKCRDV